MLHNVLRTIEGIAALILVGAAIAPACVADPGQRLVIGRISDEPHKHLESLRSMADYLAPRLVDLGVTGIDTVIAESPARMRSMLQEDRVDLFSETAFIAVEYMSEGIVKPLAREWKKGVAEYYTVIVVRKDSGLEALSDLVGRKFAFEDAGSTSGYLLPRIALEDAGLQLSQLPDPRNPVPRGTLGYSFAQGEVNVIAWVNRGLADAGALSNLDWTEADPAIAPLKNDLHVIHKTRPVIRSLFLARQSLDDRICDRIAEILFAMHETPEGNEVLRKYFKVARFDSLEGDAGKGLEEARKAWLRLRGQTQ